MFLPFPSSYLNITLFFHFRETQQDVTVILMETNAANGKKKSLDPWERELSFDKTRNSRQVKGDRRSWSAKYRWEQRRRKWRRRRRREKKKAFYFLFCQNEFQGSSAPGDVVVVRCQKASYKYRLSSERTTSQHRPLCGHKQRKWMVMQTKEEKTRAEEKQLKGGCKLVSVRRSSLVKKPTQTWRKWNEG